VLDLHTRKIVGWSMRERLYTEIALEALNRLILAANKNCVATTT
jgi:putative transposase